MLLTFKDGVKQQSTLAFPHMATCDEPRKSGIIEAIRSFTRRANVFESRCSTVNCWKESPINQSSHLASTFILYSLETIWRWRSINSISSILRWRCRLRCKFRKLRFRFWLHSSLSLQLKSILHCHEFINTLAHVARRSVLMLPSAMRQTAHRINFTVESCARRFISKSFWLLWQLLKSLGEIFHYWWHKILAMNLTLINRN